MRSKVVGVSGPVKSVVAPFKPLFKLWKVHNIKHFTIQRAPEEIQALKLNFLLLTLPASALGLILVFTALANTQNTELKLPRRKENDYWPTFKRILKSKSAVLYLVGYMVSGMVATASFAIPFFHSGLRIVT